MSTRKITAKKSQEILQQRAKEVLSTFEWERFQTLRDSVEGKTEGAGGFLIGNSSISRITDLIVPTSELAAFESAYEDFVRWLVKPDPALSFSGNPGEKPGFFDDICAPNIFRYHYNSLVRLDQDNHHPDYLYTYISSKIGPEIWNLFNSLNDNWRATPAHVSEIYWPELKGQWPVFIVRRMGEEEFRKVLKEKVPLFPPELHEFRMQVLEDTARILNAFYPPALEYCTMHNFI